MTIVEEMKEQKLAREKITKISRSVEH